ncbi:MAG: ferritin family protein [Candidatus Cloacimonetes bacterium]|nr:ferritin family protein [Candidatus Cloacimonadota bacterium]
MTLELFNEIIDFALLREHEAVQFYTDLQKMAGFAAQKQMLGEMADMERGHVKMLENIRDKGLQGIKESEVELSAVPDLKISEYLVEAPPTEHMTYQDILVTAMKREESSFKLYTELADSFSGTEMSKVLQRIAHEEATHKLHFEKLYDDYLLTDN